VDALLPGGDLLLGDLRARKTGPLERFAGPDPDDLHALFLRQCGEVVDGHVNADGADDGGVVRADVAGLARDPEGGTGTQVLDVGVHRFELCDGGNFLAQSLGAGDCSAGAVDDQHDPADVLGPGGSADDLAETNG